MTEFEPRIVGFLCNWCSYAGADLAGVSRIQYPTNIRIIRVMCSGRVDPVIVLEALAQGADGVLVTGCHLGDCHYIEGNYQAECKIKMVKKLIAFTSLEVERLRLEWISASEGTRFAEVIKDFTDQLKTLGPSPLREEKPDLAIQEEMLAAKAAAGSFRLRALVGREKKMIEEGNVYGEKMLQEEFDRMMDDIIKTEYVCNRIYLSVKDKPASVKELAEHLGINPKAMLHYIMMMRRKSLVAIDGVKGTSHLYTALVVGKHV